MYGGRAVPIVEIARSKPPPEPGGRLHDQGGKMTIGHGFHATMTARPGKGDELVKCLLNPPSLSNDDCVVFLVGRSASDPDTVYLTEGWISPEAHSRFFATESAQAFTAQLQPLLAGEPHYTDEVPIGGKATF
jgi:quinol monooxygenase YgiN